MPITTRALTTLLAATTTLAVAGAAPALGASLALDGTTLRYTAAPGETNSPYFTVDAVDPGRLLVIETGTTFASLPDACAKATTQTVSCAVATLSAVRVDLGDADDSASFADDFPVAAVTVSGGDGADRLYAPERPGSRGTLDGGAGDDVLTGSPGADALTGGPGRDDVQGRAGDDTLDGGDGDDTVDGAAGDDTVLGGAGDDRLFGDHGEDPGHDVVDGGPGVDTSDGDFTSRRFDAVQQPVVLTLAGGADDGRPGERDDVRNVERHVEHAPSTITGTDAPEHLEVFQNLGASRLAGGGGDDELQTSGGADSVDGGPGDDTIDAGFGDDIITGGPGRDRISADRAGGDCGPLWCTMPYGNDTVDARDGEVDSVTCGAGTDLVRADAADVVAPDCETVQRSGGAPPPPVAPSCRVPKVTALTVAQASARLKAAGCRVRLRGRGPVVRRQGVRAGVRVKRGTTVLLMRGTRR